ncbi:MAG TPA: hypothetical protein PLU85_10950 [Bacteroidia bacterium]|nr:hypothetical protein [Bacteroidia bacterium]QQR94265.1 MAG: hypothetical protein IPJ93_10290 [Bacteroidota bacterium]MBP7714554.1 hypothetical protein [Bacteroidia bacterium]MBP8667919.1 hypothetical protein [Bacteroidia bacterium]HOZ83444.1 hypothetical protein [Bacteroidia bacterium]
MINRSNYEVWFIDYADGQLSPDQVAEMLLFLEENPDLKNEFSLFEQVTLPVDTVEFAFKKSLKKTKPSKEVFDEMAVRFLENEISPAELEQYQQWINDFADLKAEHSLFAQIKLHADESVVFRGKNKLKKKVGNVVLLPWLRYAAAACVVAMVLFFANRNTPDNHQQAEHKSVSNPVQHNKPTIKVDVKPDAKNTIALSSNKNSTEPVGIIKHHNQKLEIKESWKNPSIEIALIKTKEATLTSSVNPEIVPAANMENSYTLVMRNTDIQSEKKQDIIKDIALQKFNSFTEDIAGLPVEKGKLKTLAVFGKIVNRLTFRRVNIETTYSDDGKLMAYSVSAGNFNFEHEVVK